MEEREKYEEGKWKGKKEHKHFWNQMESQWVSEGKDLKVFLNKKKKTKKQHQDLLIQGSRAKQRQIKDN